MMIIDKNTSDKELIDLLLHNRQVADQDQKEFLLPSSPQTFPPKDFGINPTDLKKALERINLAITNKQNILIYGDYDVDGITATAILWQVLYQKGASVLPFVPDREIDGYGIKATSFFRIQTNAKKKIDLLITVDNGIVAINELEKIIKSGTEVVVIDHHVASKPLPANFFKVHSTLTSGSVLSWIVAGQINPQADLGLAALGAVADCVTLNNINRNVVFHGLQSLRLNPNPGIKKLIQISGSKQDSLTTYDLGFILGPRINAVGRLSNPIDALRLLCSQTAQQASKFVTILDGYNKERQSLQQDNLSLAQKSINTNNKMLFIAEKSFHPGIIGLIAGRLTEKYYLPSIVISLGEGVSKGSCRSIKELDIIKTLREFSNLFIDLGGHAGAAGFSIKTENIPKLEAKITKFVNKKLIGKKLKPEKFIDAEMKLSAVNIKNCRLIKKLEPFGIGNPEPVFQFNDLRVTDIRLLGQNQEHLKLKVDDPSTPQNENIILDSIAFKKGDLGKNLKVDDTISFTAKLNLNFWNGSVYPQLIVNDILSL